MVAGRVKTAIGLQKSPANPKTKDDVSMPSSGKQQKPQKASGAVFPRSFGVYFPRSAAQVQPRPSDDVVELLRLVEDLRERESRLKTEVLEVKLIKESAAIVPLLENVISIKDSEIERLGKKIECLEVENERSRNENEFLHLELSKQNFKYEEKIKQMQDELSEIKRAVTAQQEQEEALASSAIPKPVDVTRARCLRKCWTQNDVVVKKEEFSAAVECTERSRHSRSYSDEIPEASVQPRAPRVPKPPPKPSVTLLSTLPSSSSSQLSSSVSSPAYGSLSDSAGRALAEISKVPPRPPPPPPVKIAVPPSHSKPAPPPPPPPPKAANSKPAGTTVRRVPEVVEFYHSLMRRDSNLRRDASGHSDSQTSGVATTKDMIGEIENRSSHLLAIKTDVETQGDFIRFLIKEVEGAAFTDIEDVVPFVKWLDDELSYLVDERAVLKHFDWPEQKADALREAAFGYGDLKKLEFEASSFHDDPRQPFSHALKKMQSLFDKLEHGVYNLSKMRESSSKRYKQYHIPVNWMLETGYASQLKLASVKLAMMYMKRISSELGIGGGGPEEEELIVQGVKFAFRVHQFAGGFDVETMKAFEELRDKAHQHHQTQ